MGYVGACNANFELEIVIFGLTLGDGDVLHGEKCASFENISNISLLSEIFGKNSTKIYVFEALTVFRLSLVSDPKTCKFGQGSKVRSL